MVTKLRSLLNVLFGRNGFENGMDQEMRFHLESYTADLVRSGVPRAEAERRARVEFGGVEIAQEQCRQARGLKMFDQLRQDSGYAVRVLRKNLGFTLVAVITMALGIGANSAVFSVLNTVILKPLSFKEPERIMRLGELNAKAGADFPVFSPANYLDLEKQQKSFEPVATFQGVGITYTSNGENEDWDVLNVTEGYLPTFGIPPMVGRVFTAADMPEKAPRTAILSYGLWQRKFGGDPKIIGQTLILNKRPCTVIGIMPKGFHSPTGFEFSDLWMPLSTDAQHAGWDERNDRFQIVFGRLKPGVTQTQAQNEMNLISARFAQDYPAANAGWSIKVIDLTQDMTSDIRPALLILFGAGCCVLLVACANVANLLLARASARKRELGIRAALGATRARLIRQVLTESVILTLIGGSLGVALAWWSIKIIRELKPGHLPRVEELSIDWHVLLFTLGASILAGCGCGVISGWLSTRTELAGALNEGSSRTSGGVYHARARNLLIVAEIALSLVLLVSAGLLTRSLYMMTHQNPGFDSHNVLTAGIHQLMGSTSKDNAQFYDQVITRIGRIPGIESAGLVTRAPLLSPGTISFLFSIKGQSMGGADSAGSKDKVLISTDSITPDFFKTLRIPLKAGRNIDEHDRFGGHAVCLINEEMARRYFSSNEAALGRVAEIVFLGDVITPEIVGVVGDTKRVSLAGDMQPSIYLPEVQVPWFNATIVARTKSSPMDYVRAVQQAIRETGNDQNLNRPQPMDEAITKSVAQPRFYSELFGAFAAIAVIMACVGLYGVISYMTSQRTQEIGIRVALGAPRSAILKLVLGQGMWLVAVGIALGIGGALGATRFLETLLYGVGTKDISSYLAVSILLAAVALFACYIPARRAMRVDPTMALRHE